MYELIVTAVVANDAEYDVPASTTTKVFRYEFETEEHLEQALQDMVRYTSHSGGELKEHRGGLVEGEPRV